MRPLPAMAARAHVHSDGRLRCAAASATTGSRTPWKCAANCRRTVRTSACLPYSPRPGHFSMPDDQVSQYPDESPRLGHALDMIMRLAPDSPRALSASKLTSHSANCAWSAGPGSELSLLMRLPRHGVPSGSGRGCRHDAILIFGTFLGRYSRCYEPGYLTARARR
jgi:hypothetical protein